MHQLQEHEELYQRYKNALLKGDKLSCRTIINDLINCEINIMDVYTHFFQRSLYEIGQMWEKNENSVAKEHMATSITSSLMTLFYPIIFSFEKIGKKAVVSCVANEYHQIGGKMVADLFEIKGWDTMFLGANTPAQELDRFIQEENPDALALSLAIYGNLQKLIEVIDLVRKGNPMLPIIVGGQAFKWGSSESLEKFENIRYIPSIEDLQDLLDKDLI